MAIPTEEIIRKLEIDSMELYDMGDRETILERLQAAGFDRRFPIEQERNIERDSLMFYQKIPREAMYQPLPPAAGMGMLGGAAGSGAAGMAGALGSSNVATSGMGQAAMSHDQMRQAMEQREMEYSRQERAMHYQQMVEQMKISNPMYRVNPLAGIEDWVPGNPKEKMWHPNLNQDTTSEFFTAEEFEIN